MSVSPVMSITDELVSELERSVECVWPETDQAVVALRAMLAERAELLLDAGRYRWLRQSMWYVGPDNFFCGEGGDMNDYENHNYLATTLDAAIDAAMQSEAKP